LTALPIAVDARASVSSATVGARPVNRVKKAHTDAPPVAIATRLRRSAMYPTGICNSRARIAAIDETVMTPWMSRPNASRISGASSAKTLRSSSSTALKPKRMRSGAVAAPAVTALTLYR
jgi:hypothetical protein